VNSSTLVLHAPGLALLRNALGKPSGARFYRCALQVNPASYSEKFRGQAHGLSEGDYIRAMVERAVTNGIEVLAITDHSHAGSVDAFRAEGERQGVAVFPGFEINTSEGIHLLCLYPRDFGDAQLGRFLGEFGIVDTDSSSKLSSKSFSEILELVRERGGVTIAAHATGENGLLHRLKGQPCIQAWRDFNLLAVQIPGSVEDLPQDKKLIITNKNPEYRRMPSRGAGLALAVLNAKDVKCPGDLDDPTSSSYIKMSEVTIEALRQAFLDPESRIRLGKDQPEEPQHSELVAIAWEGGFLDQIAIHLNENLNVLVGGRGTGKSTIIESIRYALGAAPKAEEARRVHESIVRNVIKAGTKISILVRGRKHISADYVVERTVPNPPIVRNAAGDVLPIAPIDLLGAVEIYGQHEISEIAKSADKRTALLARFVSHQPDTQRRKLEVKRALDKSRAEIQSISSEMERINERLAMLPRIEETLKAYQSAGLEQKLAQHTLLLREERVFTSVPERLQAVDESVGLVRRDLPLDTAFLSERALSGVQNRDLLARIEPILRKLSEDLERALATIAVSLEDARAEVNQVRDEWEKRKAAVEEDYQRVLRDLQKTKVNAEEFMQLRRQIEELKPLRDRLDLLNRNLKEQSDRRRNLLAEWEDVLRAEFQALDRAAKEVTKGLRPRVRVTVNTAGNRAPLEEFLRDHAPGKGRLSDAINALKELPSISLRALVEDCRAGKDLLTSKYHIPPAQAERICQMGEDSKMQLEELELPATTDIELNVAAEGESEDWKTLEDLSTGQKATAILLLLLLESDAPLIVDQPEDDLDNRFISEGVVPKMREEKQRRQFLFASHNANIPVLGDAELILGLRARESRAEIPPEWVGSIDSPSVQKLVEETLEGGREAFETRRLKYGFGTPDAAH
jgi:hypothetical protein